MRDGRGWSEEPDTRARIGLAAVAEPGDPVVAALALRYGWQQLWERLIADDGAVPEPPTGVSVDAVTSRMHRWRRRARGVSVSAILDHTEAVGARLVVPGEGDWPTQLDDLEGCRPYLLWLRSARDLRYSALRSVAVVGSRAASDYGRHVASELAYGLGERGWSILSGGAFGIDGAAHHAALVSAAAAPVASRSGGTIAVLPCGIDRSYPRAHERLFGRIAAAGTLLTELPPGAAPSRHGFLVRNRLIAALTPGVVVVEAGRRSGALSTVQHALRLNRLVMAVPGPVTSALSVGCHNLLREGQAVCVTDAAQVAEEVGPVLGQACPEAGSRVVSEEELGPLARRVLSGVPRRDRAVGPATIAMAAGCDLATVLRQLGLLAAAGYVERAAGGWRRSRDTAG
ncbi:DNA-processing protein DprA [Lipingzhangella sp. LS1_29]|uniref:DNA-processing protein DprA n=1 Tax=Lipingzhangella rawalii TaxID=2055835 RepID=A0ABU2H5N9_9ACTN|nr:DNA-processing protein DprA [Lipingzhangella rawalii]MDS1270622.1 DNA-processing protein DprA [Lipingzhangella rawalii]